MTWPDFWSTTLPAYLGALGSLAASAVARTVALDHPDRTEGILLMGVEGTEPLGDDAAQALQAAFADAAPREAMPVLAGDGVDPTWAWNVFSRARERAVEPMQTAALAAAAEEEWVPLAPSLPVLILQGTDDRVTVPANGDRLQASAADRASAARIDGGGYLFPMTHPGEIGMQIEDYLAWD